MGTTRDTVFLTQTQLDDLLETLHKKSAAAANNSGPANFKPVGRIEYEKRKYREGYSSYCHSGSLEIL